MLSKAELLNEIAALESQGASWQNCERLAALYTIKNELAGKTDTLPVVHAETPTTYDSGTEFSQAIRGMDMQKVFAVMDEAMETLRLMNPRLYNGIVDRLK